MFAPESVLKKSVLKTLVYFDLENYPLTREELYHYLWEPPSSTYEDFISFLDELVSSGFIQEKWGFFFLSGREEIVEKRRDKLIPTEQMLKKAARGIKLIRSVPFLKAVFICNSVGREAAVENSDIDFLIVASPKRIWLVRFFTNIILRLFRLRTYGNHEAGRICLSFFLDSEHLDLSPYRVSEDDIHFAYWINQMLPFYDPEDLYTKFIHENKWTQKFLPNLKGTFSLKCTNAIENSKVGKMWKKVWEKMWQGTYGNLLETEAQKFQFSKLKLSLKEKAKIDDKGVVLKEGILKFHEHDTRREYREKWLEKFRGIN